MSNKEKYKEDLLRYYINPEKIENAPEGFTSRVMSGVQLINSPGKAAEKLRNRNFVPLISVSVTLLLLALAIFIPVKSDSLTLFARELIGSIKVPLPQLDLTSFFNFNLPPTLVYGLIGILILSILDRVLSRVFQSEK